MTRLTRHTAGTLALAVLALIPATALAQWRPDGMPVCAQFASQYSPAIAVDDGGDATIVWGNQGPDSRVSAQRLDTRGVPLWAGAGAVVCRTPGDLSGGPNVVLDGSGNAIVAWVDLRASGYCAFAQRLDSAGRAQWAEDGVPLTTAVSSAPIAMEQDGAGGAIVVWGGGGQYGQQLYAQRIDSSGNLLWGAAGTPVTPDHLYQSNPKTCADGAGGIIVTWYDNGGNGRIWAQRLDSSGARLWGSDGIPVTSGNYEQQQQDMASDGLGGAVVAWTDFRGGSPGLVYAQRIAPEGAYVWASSGVPLSSRPGEQYGVRVAADSGATIVAFDCGQYTLAAQKIDAGGSLQWGSQGVSLAEDAGYNSVLAAVMPDVAGGAVVLWEDLRYTSSDNWALFAQKLEPDGSALWLPTGLRFSPPSGVPNTLVAGADSSDAIVACWGDQRGTSGFTSLDVYAQRIQPSGDMGPVAPGRIRTILDEPYDNGGWVRLITESPPLDWAAGVVSGYGIWRRIENPPTSVVLSATQRGSAVQAHRLVSAAASKPASTRISTDQAAAAGFPPGGWMSVGFAAATGDTIYRLLAPTRADSADTGGEPDVFVVTAHLSGSDFYCVTAPESGYSVDNLPPDPPAGLEGVVAGPSTLVLRWTPSAEPDLSHYAVYKGRDSLFVPGPSTRLGAPDSASFADPDYAAGSCYKVSAIDKSGNESGFASLSPARIGEGSASPSDSTTLPLMTVNPSPFAAETAVELELRAAGRLSLAIYDARGRLVRVLQDGWAGVGSHRLVWNGRDNAGQLVSDGVYFARLRLGSGVWSRTLVLAR